MSSFEREREFCIKEENVKIKESLFIWAEGILVSNNVGRNG